jgi:hypothetical protein
VAGNSSERIAAREVVKLAEHVEPREVVETVLAMFLLEQDQPRRFRSDPAFRTQLVRRTRGLSEVNAGTWYDAATGKTKRAYKELAPRANAVLGQWLAELFGGAASTLLGSKNGTSRRRSRSGRRCGARWGS